MEIKSKQQKLIDNYSNLDLKKLPHRLKKNGFWYELICRTNSKCLYAQKSNYGGKDKFEVFKTRIREYRKGMEQLGRANETTEEFSEAFPHDEEFGIRAWFYPHIEQAMERYDSLA